MGFFDFFRDKKDTSPDEIQTRINEIREELQAEEVRLSTQIEQYLRARFQSYWTRINGLPTPEPEEQPPSTSDSQAKNEKEPQPTTGQKAYPEESSPDGTFRNRAWKAWKSATGRCEVCQRPRKLLLVPPAPGEEDELRLLCETCRSTSHES